MSVTDFECAIARSQISRFMAGDQLGADVEQQLESHIDQCLKCRALLEEKKQSLLSVIQGSSKAIPSFATKEFKDSPTPKNSTPVDPVIAARKELREKLNSRDSKEEEAPTIAAFAPKPVTREAIKSRLDEKINPQPVAKEKPKKKGILEKLALFKRVETQEVEEPTSQASITMEALKEANKQLKKQGGMTKPLMLMLGLTIVLSAMSYVVKDPTKLLGTKANTAIAEASESKPSTGKTVGDSKQTGTAAQTFANSEEEVEKPNKVVNAKPGLTTSTRIATAMVMEIMKIKAPAQKKPAQKMAVAKTKATKKSQTNNVSKRKVARRSSKKRSTPTSSISIRVTPPSSGDASVRVYDAQGNPLK